MPRTNERVEFCQPGRAMQHHSITRVDIANASMPLYSSTRLQEETITLIRLRSGFRQPSQREIEAIIRGAFIH
jgi:hypothetical protein